jgi:hypothetical protein
MKIYKFNNKESIYSKIVSNSSSKQQINRSCKIKINSKLNKLIKW